MGYIKECPQLKYWCVFGSISQYTFRFEIDPTDPKKERKKYPNSESACTFIATNFGLKLLSILDNNLKLGINSKLIFFC